MNICEQTLVTKTFGFLTEKRLKNASSEQIKDPRSVCEIFKRSSGRSRIRLWASVVVCGSSLGWGQFLCPMVCQSASVSGVV